MPENNEHERVIAGLSEHGQVALDGLYALLARLAEKRLLDAVDLDLIFDFMQPDEELPMGKVIREGMDKRKGEVLAIIAEVASGHEHSD